MHRWRAPFLHIFTGERTKYADCWSQPHASFDVYRYCVMRIGFVASSLNTAMVTTDDTTERQ
ncbi:hypothetical protein [Corallincola spongiicola]|uniref:Uncharacterized protein n=1 Tax=Corallincola spongiicola TaxID=2520508 RepID=A0ABY1WML8_9GAMM|nr:hypothetical protein [Corallincola spongiicola]TAA43665.1 hypothetical protein EXY25_14010 [Corallincola spongiicola]